MNTKLNIATAIVLTAAIVGASSANAAIVYDNFDTTVGQNFTGISDYSYTAVFKSNINQTITGIGALISVPSAGDFKFVIFDVGNGGTPNSSGSLAFVNQTHFAADATYNYKYSAPFSFGLVANEWYAAGVIGEPSSGASLSFQFSNYSNVGPTFTAYANNNINFNNYANPSQNFGFGCCNINYQLLSGTAAVPEPAAWSLMIGGFGLAGAALRRRRSLAAIA